MYKKLLLFLFSFPKTLYFNFKYFKFKDAFKLPILVSKNVYLMETKGKIDIKTPLKFGMIKIGFGEIGIFDRHKSRTIWQVTGDVIFNGNAQIGHGSKLSVQGQLVIGKNFIITAESQIVCNHKITIGNGVMVSWENLIMDTDYHKILNDKNEQINQDKEITIGNNVWIGCRSTILKGSSIGDGVIVAATSCVAGRYNQVSESIIGGNPIKVIKNGVKWAI